MSRDKINKEFRQSLIRRVDGICAICLKRTYSSLDAHRIIPGRQKGKYIEENTIMVCPECHRIIDKQTGLRRLLIDLKDSLEWILSQHRLPGQKIKIREIRDSWECRRIKSSRDPLLESTLELFKGFREGEKEDTRSISVWLDDMITWRRICNRLLNLCLVEEIELDQLTDKLESIMDYNEDDPRNLDLNKKLTQITNKNQLYEFIQNEILRLEDYLIVQRNDDRAIGLIYFQYYYKHRYAFVSYVVLNKTIRENKVRPYQVHSLDRLVFNGLIKNLLQNHPECEGIIMEVDPEEISIQERVEQDIRYKLQVSKGRGLHRLLHMYYPSIKRIGVNYMQPKSLVHSERDERDLWLLYYPFKTTKNSYISKRTLSNVLDCVYNYVYLDELDNLDEFDANIYVTYRGYLNKLKKEIIQQSPSKIPLK